MNIHKRVKIIFCNLRKWNGSSNARVVYEKIKFLFPGPFALQYPANIL